MQDLHSILSSIPKEKLVDIISTLSEKNEDFKKQIILLASEIKAPLESKSDNARKFEQNQQKCENSSNCYNEFSLEPVSKTSTPQEKINLFKSLFIGREDVFALRWSNAKSGKSGYSPVCENKWQSGKCDMKKYSCADCPFKLPVRLSDQYIFNHLAGKDSVCRDVIGLYPLVEGDLCQFLALDFDSHDKKVPFQWKSDILQ